jgi:hypothetical protein
LELSVVPAHYQEYALMGDLDLLEDHPLGSLLDHRREVLADMVAADRIVVLLVIEPQYPHCLIVLALAEDLASFVVVPAQAGSQHCVLLSQ